MCEYASKHLLGPLNAIQTRAREVGCARVDSARRGRAVARCELLVRANYVADVPFSASAGGQLAYKPGQAGWCICECAGFPV